MAVNTKARLIDLQLQFIPPIDAELDEAFEFDIVWILTRLFFRILLFDFFLVSVVVFQVLSSLSQGHLNVSHANHDYGRSAIISSSTEADDFNEFGVARTNAD